MKNNTFTTLDGPQAAPPSTGAYARSVETLQRYAAYIGAIRARSQLASIAGNSLAARYVRDAAETVLVDIQVMGIRGIFSSHGIKCEQVTDNSHRNSVELLSSLTRN